MVTEMGMKSRKQLVINIRSSLLSFNNSWEETHLTISDDEDTRGSGELINLFSTFKIQLVIQWGNYNSLGKLVHMR